MSSRPFSYLLHGNVLYEYTIAGNVGADGKPRKRSLRQKLVRHLSSRSNNNESMKEQVRGETGGSDVVESSKPELLRTVSTETDESLEEDNSSRSGSHSPQHELESAPPSPSADDASEGIINHAYPLVNVVVVGPVALEGGKFMISISDRDGALLRGVKRCEETGRLVVYLKPEKLLILIFTEFEPANRLKLGIEAACSECAADDVITSEKFFSVSGSGVESSSLLECKGMLTSIMHGVVLPTSQADRKELVKLKNELAKTLFLNSRL